jgi:hypothetical protein
VAHSLNLTLKIKQTPEVLKQLEQFKALFPQVQGKIAAAMAKSHILHYARVVVFPDNSYIQVLTEYDGDRRDYTEFFRRELPDVFRLVFALADDAPPPDELDKLLANPDAFFSFSKDKDYKPLGTSLSDDEEDHFVFSAYGTLTVKEIQPLLPQDRLPK